MLSDSDEPKETEKQIHYFDIPYDNKGRFNSYWHQINEIISLKPERILEVGIGNGFVSKYLRDKGANIITLDCQSRLKPDVAGSIAALPFESKSFNVVACYEVLEHLPYSNFSGALEEAYRVSDKNVILSIPDHTAVYRFYLEVPVIKPIYKLVTRPFSKAIHHKFDGEHYWFIGKVNYPLKRIERDIKRTGFKIITTYRIWECHGQRFFVLQKM